MTDLDRMPVSIQLTNRQVQLVLAALNVCMPIGGGSDVHSLIGVIWPQAPDAGVLDADLQRLSNTVLQEAVNQELVAWVN